MTVGVYQHNNFMTYRCVRKTRVITVVEKSKAKIRMNKKLIKFVETFSTRNYQKYEFVYLKFPAVVSDTQHMYNI